MTLPPSDAEVENFRALLNREVGLRFDDDKLPLLAEALATRVDERKSPDVETYLAKLATSRQEIATLASTLTVSETYFFRDRGQFRALEAILRQREAAGARHLRILSAGCASGEEPYSIAVTVRETLQPLDGWSIPIVAVDLNLDVLNKARAATYTQWSLRETPAAIRQKYFRARGNKAVLADDVRRMVRFEQENLVGLSNERWPAASLDIVFCRNVLMYFSPRAAREVVAKIARALTPGGVLFLGHAENLRGLSHDFHLRHAHGTFYYQRRTGPGASVDLPTAPLPASPSLLADTSWFDAIARATSRIERLSQKAGRDEPGVLAAAAPEKERADTGDLAPAMELMRQERFQEALRLLAATPKAGAAQPDAMLLRAMLLVSTGDLAGAEGLCSELLASDELNAGAHYILAICREHAGDRAASIEHSEAAAYLDAAFAMPHLQLGRLARRAGDIGTAQRELSAALDLLSREDTARIILFGGGFSRDALVQLCRAELSACGGAR